MTFLIKHFDDLSFFAIKEKAIKRQKAKRVIMKNTDRKKKRLIQKKNEAIDENKDRQATKKINTQKDNELWKIRTKAERK